MKIPGYITVAEAAKRIGLSYSQTCLLVRKGRIEAERFGPQWLVKISSLKKFKRIPRGNPNFRKPQRQTA